jgi:catalase
MRIILDRCGSFRIESESPNYFQDIEQAAFAPAHIVDGIGYSPDKMLQARLLSYRMPNATLGTNYEQIPVNRCPFATNNTNVTDRCVRMATWENPNYFPNSFDDIQIDQAYKEPPFEVNSHYADSMIEIVKEK